MKDDFNKFNAATAIVIIFIGVITLLAGELITGIPMIIAGLLIAFLG